MASYDLLHSEKDGWCDFRLGPILKLVFHPASRKDSPARSLPQPWIRLSRIQTKPNDCVASAGLGVRAKKSCSPWWKPYGGLFPLRHKLPIW